MSRPAKMFLTAALVLSFAVTGCSANKEKSEGERVAVAARSLATRLSQRPNLLQAVRDTREALAHAGVATRNKEQTYQAPIGSAASSYLTPGETTRLAIASRSAQSARVTLRQLAQMLEDFGWPFDPAREPAAQIADLLHAWLAAAQPGSAPGGAMPAGDWFVPHFVAEGALRRAPSVDLTKNEPINADRMRFSSLELLMFTSWFEQGASFNEDQPPTGSGGPALSGIGGPSDPCSDFRRSLGTLGGDLTHAGINEIRRRLIGQATKGAPGGSIGNAFSALRILDRLMRLVTLYSSADISVQILSANPIHKPLDEARSAFKASAGVSDKEWEEYRKENKPEDIELESSISDCANQLGLPAPGTLGNVAASIGSWRVEWSAVEGMPEHATIDGSQSAFDMPGQFQHVLRPTSDHRGETDPLVVYINPEKEEDHEGKPEEVSAPVTVKAELETSARPSLRTFIDGARGGIGLAAAIAELLSGWFQEIRQPAAYATLNVTYHETADYLVTIEGTQKRTWSVSYDDPKPLCDADQHGQGEESLLFATAEPLRVRVRKEGSEVHLVAGVRSTQFAELIVPLSVRFNRQGQLDLSSNGRCPVGGGDGTKGGNNQPKAKDCGEKIVYPAIAAMRYQQQKVTLSSDALAAVTGAYSWEPYKNCPAYVVGLLGPPDVIGELPSSELAKKAPVTVTVTRQIDNHGSRGETIRTEITWKIVFTPVSRKK